MTDLAPSLESDPSVDAQRIDRNLQQIKAVEAGWKLPSLPDLVKLDLAAQARESEQIAGLLYSLDKAINDRAPAYPDQDITGDLAAIEEVPKERTFGEDIRVAFAGVAGLRPPQELSTDAVRTFKQEAVNRGYLGRDTPIDSLWTPELNSVKYEMLQDQFQERIGGERPGATSFGRVMNVVNDWMTPTGLLRAAVELDLMWDIPAISSEFEKWGDKWRKLGESDGIFDFGKNLLDALTGPIDDLLVPAINIALLFTGVSEAVNFGRVVFAGAEIARGANAVRGLWLPKAFRAADLAADAARMAEPGFLATKAMGSSRSAVSALGHGMASWRQLKPVMVAKKTVQQGMRLGLTSRVEDLLPSQSGFSAGSIPGVQEQVDTWMNNPLAWGVGEALFTPYTLLERGSLVAAVKKAGSLAGASVEKAAPVFAGIGKAADVLPLEGKAGRVLGAAGGAYLGSQLGEDPDVGMITVGALAGGILAPSAWKALVNTQKLAFRRVVENEHISMAWHRAVQAHLATDADRLQKYNQIFHESGTKTALGEVFGLGQDELGAAMTYATTMAAIDHVAAVQAGGNRAAKGFWEKFYMARNKLVAQVRKYDVTDRDQIIKAMATMGARNRTEVVRAFKKLKETVTDEQLATFLEKHMEVGQRTFENLLSPSSLPEGVLEEYLPQVLDTFGNWRAFAEREMDILEMDRLGVLDNAKWLEAPGPQGGNLSLIGEFKGEPVPISATEHSMTEASKAGVFEGDDTARTVLPVTSRLIDNIFTSGDDFNYVQWATQSYSSPLARHIDPGVGAFAVAKADTVTKQELISRVRELKYKIDLFDSLTFLKKNEKSRLFFKEFDRLAVEQGINNISDIDQATAKALFEQAHSAAFGAGTKAHQMRLTKAIAYLRSKGLSFDDAIVAARRDLQDLDMDPMWAGRYGVTSIQFDGQGKAMDAIGSLKSKRKALQQQINRTAAEVSGQSLLAGLSGDDLARTQQFLDELEGSGYKLVHGAEFIAPHELMRSMPFDDITERHINAVSLGSFWKRKTPEHIKAVGMRELKDAVLRHLVPAKADAELGSPLSLLNLDPDGPDLDTMIGDLFEVLRKAQNEAADTMEAAYKHGGWLEKRTAALATTRTPIGIQDVGMGRHMGRVMEELAPKYGEDVARMLWRAAKESRRRNFGELGLSSIEAKLRSNPQLVNALKFFGGTKMADQLGGVSGAVAKAGYMGAGGIVGYNVGMETLGSAEPGQEGTNILKGLGGAAVGALAGRYALDPLIGGAAARAAGKLERSDWVRYAYVADGLANLRDYFRFALNPIFDASRYTEGYMLSQIADLPRAPDGSRIVVKVRQNRKAFQRRVEKELAGQGVTRVNARLQAEAQWKRSLDEFKAASRGDFDFDAVESTGRWFGQVGVLGYNPTEVMASTFAELRSKGISAEKSMNTVRNMHTYGVNGRSAAEMSVNFVFFPFSFQKKAFTHLGKFMTDDFTRLAILQDAYKTYEILDEKYDLAELWRDHIPLMQKLQRFNLFAYGISPGELGGINRPFIDAFVNLFSPQGVKIGSEDEAKDLQDTFKRLLPVINDIDTLIEQTMEQGHVLASPSHLTTRAEVRKGYEEWAQFRSAIEEEMKARGYKWTDMKKDPQLETLRKVVAAKQVELARQYPGWQAQKASSAASSIARNEEKALRLNKHLAGEGNLTDAKVFQWEQGMIRLKEWAADNDITSPSPDELPPDMVDKLRAIAVQFAADDPEWRRVWRRFYERDWGPITQDL